MGPICQKTAIKLALICLKHIINFVMVTIVVIVVLIISKWIIPLLFNSDFKNLEYSRQNIIWSIGNVMIAVNGIDSTIIPII